jgi:hypothetical protein
MTLGYSLRDPPSSRRYSEWNYVRSSSRRRGLELARREEFKPTCLEKLGISYWMQAVAAQGESVVLLHDQRAAVARHSEVDTEARGLSGIGKKCGIDGFWIHEDPEVTRVVFDSDDLALAQINPVFADKVPLTV